MQYIIVLQSKKEVMEVKNVLEQLYNGEIFPAEQYAPQKWGTPENLPREL